MSSPNAVVAEPTARKVSPFLYLLVLLCFALPFATVSCNTDKASQAAAGLSGLSSGSNGSSSSGSLSDCLSGLKGKALITYSGVTLLTGSDPSVDNSPQPASCNSSGSPASSSPSTGGKDGNIGVQMLAVLAVLAVIAGLFVGALKVKMRGAITAGLAVVALLLLLAENGHLGSAVLDKISSSSGSGSSGFGAGISIGDYFNVNAGIGFMLAMALLLVAAVYNAAAFFMDRSADTANPTNPVGVPPATT